MLITVLLLFVNNMAGHGQTDHPHYPQLLVFCDKQNATILELPAVPVPISLIVNSINYSEQMLTVSDPQNCLPRLFLKLIFNLSYNPFRFHSYWYKGETLNNINFFDCSSLGSRQLRSNFHKGYSYRDQDIDSCPIFAVSSQQSVLELDLLSCAKILQVPSLVTAYDLQHGLLNLSWRKPNYGYNYIDCEHKHKATKITTPVISATTGRSYMFLLSQQVCSSPFLIF